jgi:hypothetical protein
MTKPLREYENSRHVDMDDKTSYNILSVIQVGREQKRFPDLVGTSGDHH